MDFLTAIIAGFLMLGLWGWLGFFLFLAFAIILTEHDLPETFIVALAAAGVATWYFFQINVLLLVWANPWTSLFWIAAYIGVGVLWSFFKWDRFGAAKRTEYNKEAERVADWKSRGHGGSYSEPRMIDYLPVALQNKRKFMNWIIIWWASMIWYVCSDFVQELVTAIITRLGKVYDAIAWRHFADLDKPK